MNSWVGPILLDSSHTTDGFDCGDDDLNIWLAGRALQNQDTGNSRTWVVIDDQRRVVGYYASCTAVVFHRDAMRKVRRNSPDPVPAVLLARLAVDTKSAGQGLGKALLKHFILKSLEVAQLVGVRVLLVHAANQGVAALYRRYGFEPSPIDDLTLMLLVQDIAASS